MPSLRSIGALVAAVVLGTLASAHDDDLKLAARELPYRGPGFSSPLDRLGFVIGGAGNTQTMMSPSSNVRLLGWMPLGKFSGASAASNLWGYVSPSGREYALLGLSNGTAVVDVTTPGTPTFVVQLPGPSSTWREIKTYGTWAYAVSEGGGGLQVFDMSQVDSGVVVYQGELSRAKTHTVFVDVDTGFLYRAGGDRDGLHIYDLKINPANPPLVGVWNIQYVHDTQVRTFTSGPAAGKQVAFCCSGGDGTLHVLDVTIKNQVKHLDEISYPGAAFSHQVWLSEDGRYAYLNDEFDEQPGLPTTTYVFDVYDPTNVTYLGSFTNNNTAVSHNAYVHDGLLYAANYRSGLRVFDLTQSPTNPPEVAWFDTYPANDAPMLNSLWGCYPFLPSGVVLGSDTVRGLFVWWVGEPQVTLDFLAPQPSTLNPDGDTVTMRIEPGALVEPGTAMLHYDAGAGWVGVPLVPLGADRWNAVFPALPCGTSVDYYISVSSTTNITWTSPPNAPNAYWSTQAVCSSQPFTYCVARENSCGMLPGIAFTGTSSAGATSGFTVSADGARDGKAGLLLYTNLGPGSVPFFGGTLCVRPQDLRRTPFLSAMNGSPGNCDATFSIDVNAFAAGALGGKPKPFLLQPGTRINVQMWGRDMQYSTFLSNAGQFIVGP